MHNTKTLYIWFMKNEIKQSQNGVKRNYVKTLFEFLLCNLPPTVQENATTAMSPA